MAEKYVDPHMARQLCPVIKTERTKDDDDIIEYVRKNKVIKVGDGEDDYVIQEVVVENSRVNRQAYIAKDAPDVGVMNILEKVRRSGDFTLFNQTHAEIPEGLQDYTNVPDNLGDALRSLKSGAASFEGLKAIFGDVSFEALAGMSAEEISSYLAAFVAKQSAASQPAAEGEK